MHDVLRHGLARRAGTRRDAEDRLAGDVGHSGARVPARCGKIRCPGDGLRSEGDDTANLPNRRSSDVVVVKIGHRIARDRRATIAGAENTRDPLAASGRGRVGGVKAICRGGPMTTVLLLMLFAPAASSIAVSEAEIAVLVPFTVMEPIVLLAMTTIAALHTATA